MRYNYEQVLGDRMAWIEILKTRRTQYSGTCSKCKKFIGTGDICPLKLPAKGETSAPPYCPMKVPTM
tara:strand:+ start:1113 stop:1313 length:201 start_codon:yes stop_codon:yes gene_type:complete